MPDLTASDFVSPGAADLAALWELSLDILGIMTPDGLWRSLNPAFTRVLGWPRGQVVGCSVFDLLHPDDIAPSRTVLQALAQPGSVVEGLRVRFRSADDDYRTLTWSARSSMDGSTIYTMARDMTRMESDVARLRVSEERFRQAMIWSAIGMAIVSLDGRFVDVNDALCRIVGRPPDVLTSLTFAEVTHPDDVDIDLDLARELLEGEIDHYDLEKRYLHADGSEVWVLLTGSIVRDSDGMPLHFIAQVQDISDRKRAERERARTLRELEQSNEALAVFAATAAHDLKSPLVITTSLMDLLVHRYTESLPVLAQDLLHRGRRQLQGLTSRVDGLLRLANFSGRELRPEAIDLAGAIKTACADAVPAEIEDESAALSLTCNVSGTVTMDPDALDILLHNLFRNAHVHGATSVNVTTRSDPDMTTITIDDDGPGIALEERERVFALFERGTGTISTGTGIGLNLCRRVVERHGGTITLDDSPTGGLRVQVTLPST